LIGLLIKKFRERKDCDRHFVSKSVYFFVGKSRERWTPDPEFFQKIPSDAQTLIIPVHFQYEKVNEALCHMDVVELDLRTGELFLYRTNLRPGH
jgi:hypothetical protein